MRGSIRLAVLGLAVGLPNASPAALTIDANIFVNLSKKVVPAVVNISTETTVQGGPDPMDFWGFGGGGRGFPRWPGMPGGPGGPSGPGSPGSEEDGGGLPRRSPRGGKRGAPSGPKAKSLGTGFVIDATGLILTNNHVVQGADEIKISFTESPDEVPTDGEIVGRDPELDVALIKVKAPKDLAVLSLGDSDSVEVGEYVMAVGNPFGQGHSVTHGIISAKGRPTPELPLASYLQTDAPINPGNSGGPLVNLKGEVIAINNAIDPRAHGIGFAVPISLVKKVLPQLKSKGTVSRGYLGVQVDSLTPELAEQFGAPKDLKAPFLAQVYPGQPADKGGMKQYDIVTEVNGKRVSNHSELIAAVTSVEVGETTGIKVLREGKELTLKVKVGQRPTGNERMGQPKEGPAKKGNRKKSSIDLGMELEDLTPDLAQELGITSKKEMHGVVVMELAYDGPADRSKLQEGDLIIEVDRKAVKNLEHFYSVVKEKKSYLLRVRRTDPSGSDVYRVLVLNLKD